MAEDFIFGPNRADGESGAGTGDALQAEVENFAHRVLTFIPCPSGMLAFPVSCVFAYSEVASDMADRTKKRATYEDLVAAPPDRIAELLEGELFLSPRPAPRHSRAASALVSDLHDAFDRGRSGPGGWWILFEPELHLGGDVLVPDIAGWRKERLPAIPELPWFEAAPDWICEVVSPSTERIDRTRKLPIYAAARVEFAWIVDPSLKTLEVLRRTGNAFSLVGAHFGEALVSAPPFDEVTIELGPLWT